MRQRVLGQSDLKVAEIGLGTSTWGTKTDRADAAQQLRIYLDAGGNLLDTADAYVNGRSEEIIGEILQTVVARSEVVVATKAVVVPAEKRARIDASPAHLLAALDASLARLRTDYLDLWQLHAWDPGTPLEVTLSAVDSAMRSGRVRHVGICNYAGWQTAKAVTWQKVVGAAPLVSTQVEYSLLERGIEREVIPAAINGQLSVLAWAPLGRGVLTGKYLHGVPEKRSNSRFFTWYVGRHLNDHSTRITEAVVAAASELVTSPIAVALAWLLDRSAVTAALVGARSVDQLNETLMAHNMDLVLPSDIRQRLDEISTPQIGYPEKNP